MGQLKILVAEDERDIRELISFSLEFANFQVTQAPNGEEAVKKACEIAPDLILLDVRMPKMDGFEACRTLKADERTQHIPVIFLSAKGQENEIEEGKAAGAEAYFLKPFNPDDLVKQVQEILLKYNKA